MHITEYQYHSADQVCKIQTLGRKSFYQESTMSKSRLFQIPKLSASVRYGRRTGKYSSAHLQLNVTGRKCSSHYTKLSKEDTLF